ncbi:MAG: hypothetical protein QXF43_06470 [Nitrososphaerales archaeon]
MKQTYLEDYLEDGFEKKDVVDDYKTDGNAPEDCKTDDGGEDAYTVEVLMVFIPLWVGSSSYILAVYSYSWMLV